MLCDENLVDARAVHVDDLEREPVPIALFGNFRNVAEVRRQEAAHRLVVIVILIRQFVNRKAFLEYVDRA